MWHLIGLGPTFVLSPPFCASAAAATNRTAAPAFCGSSTHPPTRRSPTRLGTGTVVMAQPAAESAAAGADGAAPTPIVSAIHVYPVKSARPQPGLSHATVTAEGLAGDRRFLVTTVDGRYQTQREIPALATLEVGVAAGGDVLSLRRGAAAFNVTVRRDRVSARACSLFGDRVQLVDQGDDAGRWLGANLLSPGGGLGAALLPKGGERGMPRLIRRVTRAKAEFVLWKEGGFWSKAEAFAKASDLFLHSTHHGLIIESSRNHPGTSCNHHEFTMRT